jgi:AbiV family abortive infection protein
LLAGSGRTARAYSLAVLAVEECGKAGEFFVLAEMPEEVRAQAPVGRLLESHQLKLVAGLLMAALPLGSVASRVDVMSDAELAQAVGTLDEPADEADRLKWRGFYVDMDRNGRLRKPSEITESELTSQLGQARRAAAEAASALLGPDAQALVANPAAERVEIARELVSALNAAGTVRTPKAAADVLLRTASKFRARKATGPNLQRQAAEWSEGRAPRTPA